MTKGGDKEPAEEGGEVQAVAAMKSWPRTAARNCPRAAAGGRAKAVARGCARVAALGCPRAAEGWLSEGSSEKLARAATARNDGKNSKIPNGQAEPARTGAE